MLKAANTSRRSYIRTKDRFQIWHVTQPVDLAALRWTVDNPDDLAFVRKVYDHLYARNPMFTSDDILALPFGRRLAP